MPQPNPIPLALEAARMRHADNPAIQAIATRLEQAMQMAKHQAGSPDFPLAGYRRGSQGDDGYGMLFSIDMSVFTQRMREMTELHAIAVATEILVAALNALGEDIEL